MKKHKTKIMLALIIIIILCIFFFQKEKNINDKFQDDIIFFKKFYFGKNKESTSKTQKISDFEYEIYTDIKEQQMDSINDKAEKEIVFNVSYENIKFENVNLSQTINKQTLINEKIAPGTSGSFEILLETNEKIKYQIKFESKNDKPQNLVFQIDGKDRKYKKLEDMEQELQGEIDENKRIKINWEWSYEGNKEKNEQDTRDGENLSKYNFIVFALGYK